MLSVTYGQCHLQPLCAKCRYTECRYSECRSAIPVRLLQPNLMYGKARSLPKSGAPERNFNWAGSCLTTKQSTWLERPARDKHSILLRIFVNYSCKKLHKIGHRVRISTRYQSYKTFFSVKLECLLSGADIGSESDNTMQP
jgi:hypothetical protein